MKTKYNTGDEVLIPVKIATAMGTDETIMYYMSGLKNDDGDKLLVPEVMIEGLAKIGKEKGSLLYRNKYDLPNLEGRSTSTGIPEHSIYDYRLKEATGSLKDTAELMKYALENNFCTAWDKNLWADIYCYRYVRDVGDWYCSDLVAAKLGTVYALLHSLYETDLYQYLELLHLLTGDYNVEKHFVLYYSAKTVQKICPKQWEETRIDLENITPELFGQLLSLMLQSKACCHLENEQKWNWTRINLLEKKREYVCKTTALKTRKTTLDNEEKNLK